MNLAETSFATDRLIARACRTTDASLLSALMTSEISTWVAAWPYPLSSEDAEKILSDALEAATKGRAFPAIVIEKRSNQPIGWLKIDIAEAPHRTAELGYWIGAAFQRQGYALELAKAAVEFAFSDLSVRDVIAGAQTRNAPSLSLLRRLGMQRSHQRDVWAPARQRFERCEFWRVTRG